MSNAFLSSGLFGSLFRDSDVAELFSAHAFCDSMIRFEIAWTRALAATDQISAEDAETACRAMMGFAPDMARLASASDTDGLPVPELVRQIKAHAPAGTIHKGATSQDVIDTAMVLTALAALDVIKPRLQGLIAGLEDLAAKFGDAALMGRTRMQAALPIRAGQRINAWSAPLSACLSALPQVTQTLARVQIGGPVGDFNNDAFASHVASELGLHAGAVWHTDRSAFADLGHWLAKLTGHLGKMGTDIALMAQQGIDEIALSGGGGSSAMPHKQNPVLAETLTTLARHTAQLQMMMLGALQHEQERSGAAWATEWIALPQLLETSAAALRHARALTAQITGIGQS